MNRVELILSIWLLAVCANAQGDFATAQPGRHFQFPRDHGSHPEFRTEWWYVTGHLDGPKSQRYGFQATFFRQAKRTDGTTEQLHLAHAALLDAKSGKFLSEEKLNRDGWDASSSTDHLAVHNGNWSLRMEEGSEAMHLAFAVKAEAMIELELHPEKPLVVFGVDGVSRKGSSPQAASHYLTFPRLRAVGKVRTGGATQTVSGEAWMDHEFSSSQLDVGQVGWDWAALQLNDGREVMVYRMRREDGSSDATSTIAVIGKDGALHQYPRDAFEWTAVNRWKSPRTSAVYPNHVRIGLNGEQFEMRPLAQDQEQSGAITGLPYWEGACDVFDANGRLIGRAFLELAGYAGDLRRHLAE